MRSIFTLLSLLFVACAFGETIQKVEYQLPPSAKNWVVSFNQEADIGTTRIYTSPGVERRDAKEFFGVNGNPFPSDFKDTSEFKKGLSLGNLGMDIDFHVLEEFKDGILYEWSGKKNGVAKIHGLGRAFSNKEGTVILSYQSENVSEIPQARSAWLPALKAAKQKN